MLFNIDARIHTTYPFRKRALFPAKAPLQCLIKGKYACRGDGKRRASLIIFRNIALSPRVGSMISNMISDALLSRGYRQLDLVYQRGVRKSWDLSLSVEEG